ncbi:MAG: hypothetical protein IKA71_07720 [Lentisphaeria bacterium]|nr:hypothetical protein [Lentisphaeria bacterium]
MRYRGITILLIAAAGILPLCAQDEVTRLRSENRQLRENNIRLEQELAAVKLWLSGVAQDQLNRDAAERERRVLLALKEFSRRGNKLVIDAVTAGEEFRRLLSGVPLGPARKAQLQLLIDALDDSARKFSALSIPGTETVESCRVLAVNRELQVAVISVGSGAGVMPGMVFHAVKDPEVRLQVNLVRHEGALAYLLEGDFTKVVPGMELSALRRKN